MSLSSTGDGPVHRQIDVGDLDVHVVTLGAGDPVVFLHGFPELWFSWRHQLPAIAASGRQAIAFDQRGYGRTMGPADIEHTDVMRLTGDVVGVLDALGLKQATLVGHDFGAYVAWHTALLHSERVRGIVALSVPYTPRTPAPPMQFFRQMVGDDFYMLWLQQPGVADAAFAADVPRALHGGWVTDRSGWADAPIPRHPAFQTADEHAVFVEALTRRGFTGGLNWYRNFDRNWELLAPYHGRTIDAPAMFLAGAEDPVASFMPPSVMDGVVTDLRAVVTVPGANHWLQQEAPSVVNDALLRFLDG
ncbi:alpha/beta fold hydrolase [Trujillonella humicola]|uniref:alpha/beta fold hydrolase n=1 Tax=Trujillonella humicola TaxID=3383699 RepID=UPI0039065F4A